MRCFDQEFDRAYAEKICTIFREKGGEIYFVELEADVEERLHRNTTENRLHHKPTKRNIQESEKRIKDLEIKYRTNSNEGEITEKNYIRIKNTNISAEEVAQMIQKKFQL